MLNGLLTPVSCDAAKTFVHVLLHELEQKQEGLLTSKSPLKPLKTKYERTSASIRSIQFKGFLF